MSRYIVTHLAMVVVLSLVEVIQLTSLMAVEHIE